LKKYDLFLFDADGTLFNYDAAEANALKTLFSYYAFDYTESVRLEYRRINSEVWTSYEKGEITKNELQTLRFARLFEYMNVNCDKERFNEEYLYELGKGSFLIDGAFEICKQIVSYNKRIYIVTNGILATQQSRIEHSLIKDYISGFFVSEFIGFQKPHNSYFEYVFSHIPYATKNKTLIIGDSLSTDIAGGNNAGIDSCWFNSSHTKNGTDIVPTYEIYNLRELYKFIN